MKNTAILAILAYFFSSTIECFGQNDYAIINGASAGITKTDLRDSTLVAPWAGVAYYNLDLDKNGVTDLQFRAEYYTSGSGGTRMGIQLSTSDNCLFFSASGKRYDITSGKDTTISTVRIPKIMNSSDTLYNDSCKSTKTIITEYTQSASLSGSSTAKDWVSGTHYIGIKKIINSNEYIGWVELEVSSIVQVKFKSYSIQTLPIGISELTKTSASVYPNPANDKLYIKDIACSKIEIYNAAGSLVSSEENKDNISFISIDIANLSQGIYTLIIVEQGTKRYYTTKIVK